MTDGLNIIIQGVLLGALYTLFALGLSLAFGVMRIVNIAHGDFIVLFAYIGLTTTQVLGLHPFTALLILVPLGAALGWGLQRYLFDRIVATDPLIPLLTAFGLSIIIQNVLFLTFTGDTQKLNAGPVEQLSVELLPGLAVGVYPLMIFAVTILLIFGLQRIIYRTGFGRLLRAVSDSDVNAKMLGINTKDIYRKAFAIVMTIVAIAAVLMAVRANFDPASGPSRLLFAFEAVVIGGLGNLWGTLAGGVIIGLAQTVGAQIDASWQLLSGHVVFLIALLLRPQGLFPKINQ